MKVLQIKANMNNAHLPVLTTCLDSTLHGLIYELI